MSCLTFRWRWQENFGVGFRYTVGCLNVVTAFSFAVVRLLLLLLLLHWNLELWLISFHDCFCVPSLGQWITAVDANYCIIRTPAAKRPEPMDVVVNSAPAVPSADFVVVGASLVSSLTGVGESTAVDNFPFSTASVKTSWKPDCPKTTCLFFAQVVLLVFPVLLWLLLLLLTKFSPEFSPLIFSWIVVLIFVVELSPEALLVVVGPAVEEVLHFVDEVVVLLLVGVEHILCKSQRFDVSSHSRFWD